MATSPSFTPPAGRAASCHPGLRPKQEPQTRRHPDRRFPAKPSEVQGHPLKLRYLPPISFTASLPQDYPVSSGPAIGLVADWLSEDLQQRLLDRLRPCEFMQAFFTITVY